MCPEAAPSPLRADVAVVGAGAAGLYAALVAADAGARVALVSSSPLAEAASYWAQGGIAAALAPEDSPEGHLSDTVTAGRGAVRESAARTLCEEAPARVRELEQLGVRFDAAADGRLALGLEGGHSMRRVVHAGGSTTGRRITRELSALAANSERIEVLERTTASALLVGEGRCAGLLAAPAAAARRAGSGGVRDAIRLLAQATILATGGAAALWERTTNPPGAVGAGMALAHSAEGALADLELVQFHPTALAVSGARDGFLITEAVRGEGALLLNGRGERFVDELAPRDEVALAIQAELRESGEHAVGLDMRAVDVRAFPNVAAALGEAGIAPQSEPVPVAPAAHYTMGGIATDLDGRASLRGLYAVGECACTGMHGANRLASNSLAECLVFGRRAALAACDEPQLARDLQAVSASRAPNAPSPAPTAATRGALWRCAGLTRSAHELTELAADPFPLARLIAASCLARAESRGAHQRSDRPQTDPALDGMHTVVRGAAPLTLERWE